MDLPLTATTTLAGLSATSATAPQTSTAQQAKLRQAATALEASFLAEMLKSAGVGKMPETFGGGVGEDQFATLLVREQAQLIADKGGIGLAESLFDALKVRAGYVD